MKKTVAMCRCKQRVVGKEGGGVVGNAPEKTGTCKVFGLGHKEVACLRKQFAESAGKHGEVSTRLFSELERPRLDQGSA